MTLVVYLVVALAAVVFASACPWRAAVFARARFTCAGSSTRCPTKSPERVAHGGSYLEQSEWWRHPRRTSLAGELRFMVPEILFLHALADLQPAAVVPLVPVPFRPLSAAAARSSVLFGGALTARLTADGAGAVVRWARGCRADRRDRPGARGCRRDRAAPPPADRPGAPGLHDAWRHLQPAVLHRRARPAERRIPRRGGAGRPAPSPGRGTARLGRDPGVPPAAGGRRDRRPPCWRPTSR